MVSKISEIIEEFVANAEHDRYALVVNEDMEWFAREYLKEILEAYPCTGILVRQSYFGTAFHGVRDANPEVLESIKRDGLKPSEDAACTFGDGVLYAYPTPAQAVEMRAGAVYEVHYGPGTLRAIYTQDKEEFFQGELLIPPETILYTERYF